MKILWNNRYNILCERYDIRRYHYIYYPIVYNPDVYDRMLDKFGNPSDIFMTLTIYDGLM